MSYLFLYLGITVAGYLIGSQLKKRGIRLSWVTPMQTAVIVVLVFLMGSRIGSNREIVASLDTIGLVSLVYTLIVFFFTVLAYSLVRRLLGFDRYGIRRVTKDRQKLAEPNGTSVTGDPAGISERGEEAAVAAVQAAPEGATDGVSDAASAEAPGGVNRLTILIVAFVAIGILSGYFLLPAGFIAMTGTLLTITLCMLLILIGVDIGTAGTLAQNFRSAGWRVLVFPFVCMAAMAVASLAAAVILPMSYQDALCVGAGFAWYSLAPAMLTSYSLEISAISFMHNVFREILGMLLVPVIARRVGYIESYSLPGACSMDVCLPVIERATSADVAVYSFINGAIVSASVPVLVSIFMSL